MAKLALHARMSALLEDIRENPFTLRLVVQPFTPEHTQAFLNAALDGVQVSADVARNLWEKTGGLPLYIEQANAPPTWGNRKRRLAAAMYSMQHWPVHTTVCYLLCLPYSVVTWCL